MRTRVALILGAGFPVLCGLPLARDLFAAEPLVDTVSRRRLVVRVLGDWEAWEARGGTQPEVYLAELEAKAETSPIAFGAWNDAVQYIALLITLRSSKIRHVGRPRIVDHGIYRTTGCPMHEAFWDAVFERESDLEVAAVITTNYDVLIERGLRYEPRPRKKRPGFHYGFGAERLLGSGFPSYAHIKPIVTTGMVPLLKLHGSVSWSRTDDGVLKYIDCRPAIQGNAAIVAPALKKSRPPWLEPVWALADFALRNTSLWIALGYSFPEYDIEFNRLVKACAQGTTRIVVMNPSHEQLCERVATIAPHARVEGYPGLPDAIDILHGLAP